MTAAAAWALARRVLFFAIPVPVALILAAWAWVAIDKSSAVRRAVNAAVEKLVDGTELAAERARVAALQKILAERERQAEADRAALRAFADQLAAAETENGTLADALALIENQPVDPLCRVDRPLLERLRERQGGTSRGG
jgi:type II secretory pathway component PulF